MDKDLVLPVLVAERARSHPDKVFVEEVGGERLTYAEYDREIRRWSTAFRRVGVEAGDRVVTMLPASVQASCAWLGLGWLTAIEVPCNNEYRGRMLGYLVANSGARVILIHSRFIDRLAEVVDELPEVRTVVVFGGDPITVGLPWEVIAVDGFLEGAEPAAIEDLPTPLPSDLCALLYTSGTTGNSKGVCFPWGQLYTQGIGFIPLEDLTEDDAWYMPYPINHVSGKTPFYTMILANGRIVIRNGFDTAAFWGDIDAYGCTSTAMLGPMAPFLFQQEPRDDDADHVLHNVFMVPIPPFIDDFKARFDVRVCTSYGSVENSVPIKVPGWGVDGTTWRSCGRLRTGWPGYEVRLVDEHDQEVPVGEVGELICGPPSPGS